MGIAEIRNLFFSEIKDIRNARALEDTRIKYLGRKDGLLTKILRSLKDLPIEEKKKIGPAANALRQEIEEQLNLRLKELSETSPQILDTDLTMPGKKVKFGHLHPLTLIENRIKEIFLGLNFSVVEGPEIETEYYNFDALNIPESHPVRDMWDTFWLKSDPNLQIHPNDANKKTHQPINSSTNKLLLRTHTSPMQIRYMEKHQPPFQIIVPGRVFRFEATDASHEINFHQVEGLMVGEDVSLANFKYVIEQFLHRLFSPHVQIRFRPSYFPFVEPGLEVDIKIANREAQIAKRNNKNEKEEQLMLNDKQEWLEVMGAGMVHPKVLGGVGYNPKYVQGFAFGLGLERLAMIKYKIPDIRLFYSGDLRFVNQF